MCVHPLQVVVLLCTLLYSTVYSIVVQCLYFKLDLRENDFIELLAVQHEELTYEDLMELEAQKKDEERQEEEVTEEAKRFTTQEMARGFSLFEEAMLVFEAQDPNVEWYTKVAAAVQNAIQCYHVIYDEKKNSYYPYITGLFFQDGRYWAWPKSSFGFL